MRFPFFRNRDSVKNGILISIRRTGDGFHPGLFRLTLGELIGWHRIWLALVLAIVIESWQYAAGTGMAQVTDVICNTLGAWIGGIAFQKRKHCL